MGRKASNHGTEFLEMSFRVLPKGHTAGEKQELARQISQAIHYMVCARSGSEISRLRKLLLKRKYQMCESRGLLSESKLKLLISRGGCQFLWKTKPVTSRLLEPTGGGAGEEKALSYSITRGGRGHVNSKVISRAPLCNLPSLSFYCF